MTEPKTSAGRFEISTSCHGQMCIELRDATPKEKWFLRRAVCDQLMTSEFYQRKQKPNPFLQGDQDNWILVEFWTDKREDVQDYVAWLNSVYAAEVDRVKRDWGGLP